MILVTVLLVVLSGMPRAIAQTTPRPQPAVAPATFGAVIGTAWKGDTTPYPQARIRLRNVETGRAVARTVSDADGRFHFDRVDPGVYVVELASNDDKVLAVGDLFSVTVGDQATTLVRLSLEDAVGRGLLRQRGGGGDRGGRGDRRDGRRFERESGEWSVDPKRATMFDVQDLQPTAGATQTSSIATVSHRVGSRSIYWIGSPPFSAIARSPARRS